MRKLLFGLAVAVFATTASAQQKPFLGVGAQVGLGSMVIAVPMNVSPMLRVEPFLGYWQDRTTNTSGPDDAVDWDSYLTLGAGVFLLNDVGGNVELHYGGRLAINRDAWGWDNGTTDDSGSDIGFRISGVGGAEYYFSPRFALGVEAELYIDTIKDDEIDTRYTSFGTATWVTARLYFK